MAHLHEIVAIEGDLRGEKDRVLEDSITTFTKKTDQFFGTVKTLEMFDESRKQEDIIERKELSATVKQKLDIMKESQIKYYDLKLQKEVSNQSAKSDITVDGVKLGENIPVVFLLLMEEELKRLRKVYEVIPTLQPGISWEEDSQLGEGIYKSKYPIKRNKTEKIINSKVVYEATKEHPAQLRDWSEDKPIGVYTENTWSGMLSTAEKSILLGRIDKLLREVKRARQRANTQTVTNISIGEEIFKYIHGK